MRVTSSITLSWLLTRQKTPSPLLNMIEQCFATHVVHTCQQYPRCSHLSTILNNIVEPESGVTTLFNIVDNRQLWTMWAAKHCSILFSSILDQPERFYACSKPTLFCLHNNCDITLLTAFILTYPVNFPCWWKLEYPEKTHDFHRALTESFHTNP
jgi:hypothetical protein